MLTLRQLAGLAGVSTSTVSKALNNSPDISAETRDQILELATRHGYQRKFRKKSAAKPGISGPKIGLIYSDVVSRYYSKLIQAYNVKLGAMDGVLLACDASKRTTQHMQDTCRGVIPCAVMPLKGEDLRMLTPKPAAVFAVTDENLAHLCAGYLKKQVKEDSANG